MKEELERQAHQDSIDLAREEQFRLRQTLVHNHIAKGREGSIREEYHSIRASEEDLRERELVLSNSQPGAGIHASEKSAWERKASRLQRRLWIIMLILVALVLSLLRISDKLADNQVRSGLSTQPEPVPPTSSGE